ncbi:uncharacterized protein LOC112574218 [Pomacea canaliculata]|uniref:uncharacterized protein LOC112574218 n=1 Tax=Pomacea canaliculata TaxID=400727 RepID=UPI000D73D565|nr:uncharacterized protein LOC112574218 [Pomacea canaliculata]
MSWTSLFATAVALTTTWEVESKNLNPTKVDLGGGLSMLLVRAVRTVSGNYRARMNLCCYDTCYWNFGVEAEYNSNGKYSDIFWPPRSVFPPCDSTIQKKIKKSSIDKKRLREIKRSYLTNLGLKRKDVKRVSQKVELVLREINGIIEPVVFADVIYENAHQAVRFVAQFAALTGELVFVHDKLLLEKVQESQESLDSDNSDSEDRDDRSDSNENIKGSETVCAIGSGGNPLTGYISYGSGTNDTCLPVAANRNKCSLYLDGVGQVRSGRGHPRGCLDSPPISFPCDVGLYDAVNEAPSVGLDAMRGIYLARDVLRELNIEVPASCQVDVCVNFGNHLQNSMWTGKSILVGDGREGRSYPFSTPDCMCHEFAHCLTDSWSGLLMNGQAGGINDAFSDAFSQVCKLNIGGPSWTVGETNFYDGSGSTPIRYFEDPTLDGYSIDNAANYTEDLDSHLSCGVYNKFFFCLSVDKGWDL